MRSFPKAAAASIVASLAGAASFFSFNSANAGQPVKKNEAPSKDGGSAAPGKNVPGASDAAPAPSAEQKASERMHDIPVSPNHPAKGLRIPYFDNQGKMQMMFVIGVATRIDADHINMADMQIETFDEIGDHEMAIDLPTSVLDLNTSVISTKKHVTITREDFTLTGEAMEFNTKTKQGTLGGGVKMIIFNLDNPPPKPGAENAPHSEPAAPATPQPASK